MKNALIYYYNLDPEEFYQQGEDYFLHHQGVTYRFCCYKRPIEEIVSLWELNRMSFELGYPYQKIVLNRDRQVLTLINERYYVLLRFSSIHNLSYVPFSTLRQENLVLSVDKVSSLIRSDWKRLWSSKVDYFEYQMAHLGRKYPLLLSSLPYFIGLAENAIGYLEEINRGNREYPPLVISHRRVGCHTTLLDYYNPLELVIDVRARDVSEYLKSLFWERGILEVDSYIDSLSFSKEEFQLLYARLLFPCFYFDCYEKIVFQKEDEKKIRLITDRIEEYEYFLFRVYESISKRVSISPIAWLNHKFAS